MRGSIVNHDEAVAAMAAERYVLGELQDAEREQFEEHFFGCPECAQDVRDLATITDGAREWLREPRKAAPKQKAPAPAGLWGWLRLSPSYAMAGALAASLLAGVTGYAGYEVAQLRGGIRPQAVDSFLLRPETRGEAAEIPVHRIGSFLLFEADVPGATGEVQWDLARAGSQKLIEHQSAPAPQQGASFKVLLPASVLPPGDYTLTVRSTSNTTELGLFKFKITANGG